MKKYSIIITIVLCAMISLTGCKSAADAFQDAFSSSKTKKERETPSSFEYQPKYVITIHQIVTNKGARQLEQAINTIDGGKIRINTGAILDSSDIIKMKLLKTRKPNSYDLALKLTNIGKKKWMILLHGHGYEPISFCVDMVHQQVIYPCYFKDSDTDWVVLKGPFYDKLAEEMVKYAEKNFNHVKRGFLD